MGEVEGNNKRRKMMNSGNFISEESVNLESLLPIMELRVLLVEADDSTRQIVSALLRKCNYRVSAVHDGLKAWELLKAKPHNIDLILTEVDLPSISGFALLTLIMEHEICKSIPVIMMSSQDSISKVYKYMWRGAADYLFKPIRINELRNLWQHVWRRQSSITGKNTPQDESVGQKKVEASSENNAGNHSGECDCLACVERNKEQIEKGNDTQSSCTKPDMEAEDVRTENMLEFSCIPSNTPKHEVQANPNQKLLLVETGDDAFTDSPREAIDFMETFDRNCDPSLINSTNEFDSSSHLDLSLSRCYHNASENHATQEKLTLGNPNSSAFTRYSDRPSPPLHSTLTSVSDQKQESDTECNFDTPSQTLASQRNTNSSGQLYDQLASNSNHLIDQPLYKPDLKLDSTEERRHISHKTDQSPSSSVDNGSSSPLNGISYGSSSASNGNIEEIPVVRASTSSNNDDVFPNPGGNSHRFIEREAALNKFRLKRKDRCYEKKVRYESRKKLAEQRPRVKGQFVRQVPVDQSHMLSL